MSKQSDAIANGVLVRFLDASPRVMKAWDAISQTQREEIMEECSWFVEEAVDRVVDDRIRGRLG